MLLTIHVTLKSRKQDPQGEPPIHPDPCSLVRVPFGWNAAKPGQGGDPDVSGTHAIDSQSPHTPRALSAPPMFSATCRPRAPGGLLTLLPELILLIPHHPPRGSVETWRQPRALLSLTAIHHLGTPPGLLTLPLNHTHAHAHPQAPAHPRNRSQFLEDPSTPGPSRQWGGGAGAGGGRRWGGMVPPPGQLGVVGTPSLERKPVCVAIGWFSPCLKKPALFPLCGLPASTKSPPWVLRCCHRL